MMEDTTKMNKSQLGTKEYWDNFYSVEKRNFEENPEDTGEVWFDENSAEDRMVSLLQDMVDEGRLQSDSSILDLGTGNGHMLFSLQDAGFDGRMLGVDYSQTAVELATEIQNKQYQDVKNVEFAAVDIFSRDWAPEKFDIVLDKGTLDAIALSGTLLENGKSIVEIYPQMVDKVLSEDGIFLITSCNFTEEELIKLITAEHFRVVTCIEYPSFKFGGVEGSPICGVAFARNNVA